MKFIERIKKDKDFRWKAILIFIVAVFLIGNMTDTKKEAVTQEVCNEANTKNLQKVDLSYGECGWSQSIIGRIGSDSCIPHDIPNLFKPENTAVETCTANLCEVGMEEVTGLNRFGCFACVPLGIRTASKENCCSNEGKIIDADGTYKFLCISSGLVDPVTGEPTPNTPRPGAVCKNDVERTFAGFLDSADFADEFTCKQKYYAVAFGGGFAALIFLMAVI